MQLIGAMIIQLKKDLEKCTTAEDFLEQKGVIRNLTHALSEQRLLAV